MTPTLSIWPILRLPRGITLNARFAGITVLTAVVAGFLAYMVVEVPLSEDTLSRSEVTRYWAAAAISAVVVLAGVLLVVSEVIRARRYPAPRAGRATRSAAPRPVVPRSLRFEHVPVPLLAVALAVSLAGVAAAFVMAVPMWVGAVALALPLLPLLAIEARWKYAVYGVFAAFLLLNVLQIAHMGEHSMQVGQLLVHQGDLTQSHGAIGQLDFELVHFVTDTTLWIVLGILLIVWRGGNTWLWVAFAAASFHQVEHFYLFWMYQTHESFYAAGGFAGIMGESGLIGTPLDRPYLHFSYNFIVVVPMAIALWDEARKTDARGESGKRPGRARPAR